MAQNRVVEGQKVVQCYLSQDPIGLHGNNPTFYGYVADSNGEIDPFGLMAFKTPVKASDVKQLLSGKDVHVKSIKEADALLKAALPDAKKIKSQHTSGEPDFGPFKGKHPNGMYHKDYKIDPDTGNIFGHAEGNKHGKMKHINIKLPDGKKVAITIEPNAKSKALFKCKG